MYCDLENKVRDYCKNMHRILFIYIYEYMYISYVYKTVTHASFLPNYNVYV